MPSRALGLRPWLSAAALVLLGAVTSTGTARAQAEAAVEREGLPRGRFELGYALSFRQDSQAAGQVDVDANGLAPSHLRADAAVFFGDLPLGLAARFGWERFALEGENLNGERVNLNAIAMDAGGGLAVRFDLRGWALEADVGYAWHRLPIVDSSVPALRSGAIQSHGPLLAVRFGKPTGWFQPEVHASTLPYAMGQTPLGSSTGWRLDAGVGLGFGGLPLGGLEWTAVLGYDYGTEQLDGEGGRFVQGAHRVGLGLRVAFPGPSQLVPGSGSGAGPAVDPAAPGTVRGLLLDPEGRPVPVHPISILSAGRPDATVQTGEDGRFTLAGVSPGLVTLKALAEKLKPAQAQAEVPPGGDVSVELRFARPTGPGAIRGAVFVKAADPASRTAVAGARLEAPGLPAVETDAGGAFVLTGVPAGLVPLKVVAKGFVAGEEVVSVAAEAESRVELFLVAEKARPLATLRGVIRAVGGKPLAARLSVPEAKVQATASAKGEFQVKVPGGKYQVRIEARGYVPQSKTVEVADGDQAIFNIDMHPAK